VTRRICAVAVLLLALASAHLRPATVALAQGSGLSSVQALLDARSAAVLAGDRDTWLATVDPRAPAPFRDAQARSFDGLRSLPLAVYRLEARVDDSGDLSTGLANQYEGATGLLLPETRQVYRLTGYDDRDAVDTMWWTYVERDGRWYVAGDDDLVDLGLDTARNLWDLGAVRVQPTEHFLVLSHPEQADRATALASIAEDAMAALNQRWTRAWSQRIPLVLPGSVEELETMLQSTFDLDNFVAFVSYGAVRDDGYEPTAPRIFIQDRNLSRYDRRFQVETLLHELVHAASVPLVGPLVPGWVHEGVADWAAKGRPTNESAPKGTDRRLPRDHEFTVGGGASIVRAYNESRSAMSYLSSRGGVDAPPTMFAAIGEARVAPGSPDYHVDRVLRGLIGVGFNSFEQEWARR
jgi:hypothetical protein